MKTTLKLMTIILFMSMAVFAAEDKEMTLDGTIKSAKSKKGEKVFVLLVDEKTKVLLPANEDIDYKQYLNKKVTVVAMGKTVKRGKKEVTSLSSVSEVKESKEE